MSMDTAPLQQASSFSVMINNIPKSPKKPTTITYQPPHNAALQAASPITPTNVDSVKYGAVTPTNPNFDANGNLNVGGAAHSRTLSPESMQLHDVQYIAMPNTTYSYSVDSNDEPSNNNNGYALH